MAGTESGGFKARDTNMKKYGPTFYQIIGAKGGKNSNNGGFGSSLVGYDGLNGRERAKVVGAIGGKISKRRKRVQPT